MAQNERHSPLNCGHLLEALAILRTTFHWYAYFLFNNALCSHDAISASKAFTRNLPTPSFGRRRFYVLRILAPLAVNCFLFVVGFRYLTAPDAKMVSSQEKLPTGKWRTPHIQFPQTNKNALCSSKCQVLP